MTQPKLIEMGIGQINGIPCYTTVRNVKATLVLNEGRVGHYGAVGQATEGF